MAHDAERPRPSALAGVLEIILGGPVRVAAIRALERIGDPAAASAIAGALSDPHRVVRHSARRARPQLGVDARRDRR